MAWLEQVGIILAFGLPVLALLLGAIFGIWLILTPVPEPPQYTRLDAPLRAPPVAPSPPPRLPAPLVSLFRETTAPAGVPVLVTRADAPRTLFTLRLQAAPPYALYLYRPRASMPEFAFAIHQIARVVHADLTESELTTALLVPEPWPDFVQAYLTALVARLEARRKI